MQKLNKSLALSTTTAAIIAVFFMLMVYLVGNYRIPISAEKAKLQLFEKIRAICFGEPQMEVADSVVMIDVHYDKQMVVERDGGMPNGMVPVTSREKLLKLLTILNERQDYRYIMLDVFLSKSVRQESDTVLYHLISKMPRIVIAKPLDEELADTCLIAKAGSVKYGTAIWENDFVKYQYQSDNVKSMPLKMYEELTGNTISRHWGHWYTDGGLARNCVILTYEFYNEDMSWDLGTGLLGDTLDNKANVIELDNLETKGKYILIGDFETDRHQIFLYEMSGTSILFNAYLTLLHRHHVISFALVFSIFVIFWLLAWLTITQNERFKWFTSIIGIPSYLFVLSLLIYLIAREAYDVLIATTLFWFLKGIVEVLPKVREFYINLRNII